MDSLTLRHSSANMTSSLDPELQRHRLQDGMGRVPRRRVQDQVLVSVKYAGINTCKLTSNRGLGPNPKDAPGYWTDYSIPAITYEDGTSQMDSWPIAHELEKRYPSPSLHLDDPITVKIRDLISPIVGPVIMQFLPYVPDHLPERSREWFYKSRNAAFGKPIQEVHKEALANADEGWKQCYEVLKEAADLLKKHEGPFFMLYFVKLLDESAFDKMVSQDPAFSKLYEATSQWFTKAD
jgi:hypothetical protein